MTNGHVLSRPPISGSIEEYHFDAAGDCTWIEFDDDSGARWAGVFGRGISSASKVVVLSPGPYAFVVSGGVGYLVDTDARTAVFRSEQDYLWDAIAIPDRNLVATSTFSNLFIFGLTPEPLWNDAIALDGIRLVGASPAVLHAEVEDVEGWYEYTLNLDSWTQNRGRLLRPL